jgi:hypothetical protein
VESKKRKMVESKNRKKELWKKIVLRLRFVEIEEKGIQGRRVLVL